MENVVPFAAVPAGLAEALQTKGFSELTAIQEAVLRPDLAGRDLRMSSQTGSGKTVAMGFVLASEIEPRAYKRLPRGEGARPDVVLVAPTRELAAQLGSELTWLYKDLGARVVTVTGGTNLGGDFNALAANPAVLVGTPGRLVDHLKRGSVDLSHVKAVVLDEADEMLDMGFRDELQTIVAHAPEKRRTHLVSATFPREVRRLADSYQTNAAHVAGTKIGAANTDILHLALPVSSHDRSSALINVLLTGPKDRTLVFVRTRMSTSEVASGLMANGFSASALSGDMSQRERTATLEAFRGNAIQCLVATEVAARGLDVQDVARVVHYDLPENDSAYTHRSGRTGRAGKQGTSIAFVPPSGRRRIEQIASRAGVELEWRHVPTPGEIREAANLRLLAELEEANETLELGGFQDLAAQLLEGRDPTAVVASLLERIDHAGPCEPREVRKPKAVPQRSGANDRRPRGGHPDRRNESFTVFNVNMGSRHGANPSRLLALACRRGDVRGHNIGAIRIGDHRSTVEVASHLAEAFATAAQRPDARNPKVRIQLSPDQKRAQGRPMGHSAPKKHGAPKKLTRQVPRAGSKKQGRRTPRG